MIIIVARGVYHHRGIEILAKMSRKLKHIELDWENLNIKNYFLNYFIEQPNYIK